MLSPSSALHNIAAPSAERSGGPPVMQAPCNSQYSATAVQAYVWHHASAAGAPLCASAGSLWWSSATHYDSAGIEWLLAYLIAKLLKAGHSPETNAGTALITKESSGAPLCF